MPLSLNVDEKDAAAIAAAVVETLAKWNALIDRINRILDDHNLGKAPAGTETTGGQTAQ